MLLCCRSSFICRHAIIWSWRHDLQKIEIVNQPQPQTLMMRPSVGDKCYSISIDSFTIREMTKFRADCVIFTTTADTLIPTSLSPWETQGGMNKPVISRRMENLALLMTWDESPDFPRPRSEWKLPPACVSGGQWRPIRGHYLGLGQNTLVTLLWWQIEALVHWSSLRLYCG